MATFSCDTLGEVFDELNKLGYAITYVVKDCIIRIVDQKMLDTASEGNALRIFLENVAGAIVVAHHDQGASMWTRADKKLIISSNYNCSKETASVINREEFIRITRIGFPPAQQVFSPILKDNADAPSGDTTDKPSDDVASTDADNASMEANDIMRAINCNKMSPAQLSKFTDKLNDDVVPTDADVVPTAADVAPTAADVASTAADVASTAADVAPTDTSTKKPSYTYYQGVVCGRLVVAKHSYDGRAHVLFIKAFKPKKHTWSTTAFRSSNNMEKIRVSVAPSAKSYYAFHVHNYPQPHPDAFDLHKINRETYLVAKSLM